MKNTNPETVVVPIIVTEPSTDGEIVIIFR